MNSGIITGKPIPPMKRRGAPTKYPWLQLQSGQAFQFAPQVTFAGARSMASIWGNQLAVKFSVRQTDEGIFCWRIDGTPHAVVNGNYAQEPAVLQDYAAVARPAVASAVVGFDKKPDPDVI